MHRFPAVAVMLMTLVAVSVCARNAAGAPITVTLTGEELRELETLIAASRSASKPLRQTRPKPPIPDMTAAAAVPAGSSMSGSPPPPVSGVAAADLPAAVVVSIAMTGSYLCTSDWFFIPPRFLDGVFRPPRTVSL